MNRAHGEHKRDYAGPAGFFPVLYAMGASEERGQRFPLGFLNPEREGLLEAHHVMFEAVPGASTNYPDVL